MKRKRTVIKLIFFYTLLTTGLWMFLMSYANSYNRLTTEKISPASLNLSAETAEMTILENTFHLNIEKFLPESKLYYLLYLVSPDEIRLSSGLISVVN
ncbi:MAG: hypothetical protein IJX77_01445 [Ruminococcus sp.]|nr:hypothetical protein [Ruminococcus sp.]